MSTQKNIIIKTVKKNAAAAHHGGSWKVAYADFVTGLMAFFLLMWLVAMASSSQKAGVATYFKEFNILEKGGASSGGSLAIMNEGGGKAPVPKDNTDKGDKDKKADPKGVTPEQLQEKLRSDIQAKLKGLEDQIMIEVFRGGVRIQLVDKAGQSLFPLGGSAPTEVGKKMLEAVAGSIKDVPNKITIEGHTDALSYSSSRYTNWELSTERASAARKELETFGLNPDSLAQVAGYAATMPLIRDNPNDPRNRRISIIIQYPESAEGEAAVSASSPIPLPRS
ncbi:MAG: OmpA family protein [Deltaproteobacteria bacterium]|nr:OmpA family protein [Deltaproteobacteria bacterium]